MFKLDNLNHVRTFACENPIVRYTKQAVFVEDSRLLVGGTDRGCAVVYETESGNSIQTLAYTRGGLVQYVAVNPTSSAGYTKLIYSPLQALTLHDRHLIAIAGSTLEQPADVVVYRKMCSGGTLTYNPGTTLGPTQQQSTSPDSANPTATSSLPSDNSIVIGIRIRRSLLRRIAIRRPSMHACYIFLRNLFVIFLAMFGIYTLALQYGPPLVGMPFF